MTEIVAKPGSLEPVQDTSLWLRHIAPRGVTPDMVQKPTYWKNNIRECGQTRVSGRPAWNRLEIIAEDGTWELELRVISAAAGLVTTRVIREWHQPARPGRKPNMPENYIVEHIPENGWRALDADRNIIADRLPVEEEAIRAAAAHAKVASGKEAA